MHRIVPAVTEGATDTGCTWIRGASPAVVRIDTRLVLGAKPLLMAAVSRVRMASNSDCTAAITAARSADDAVSGDGFGAVAQAAPPTTAIIQRKFFM